MTKSELVSIVDRIYASWNQTVSAASSKTIYEAWWRVLQDLTVVDVDAAVDTLVSRDSYMPRPGSIRRLVKLDKAGGQPPDPMLAWHELREMAENVHNGTYSPGSDLHPCVKEALARLGGLSALALHTNGDREIFLETYRKAVIAWEDEQLAL